MKIEVLQENIIKALQVVTRFVDNKPLMPILSNMLIKAQDSQIELIANNMETGIVMKIPAHITESGAVCVPAKLLSEYVGLIPPGKIELTLNDNQIILKSNKHTAKLATLKTEDFPEIPNFTSDQMVTLTLDTWEKIVKLVSFTASQDDTRPVLTALLFEFDGAGTLQVVATDGYRLSLLKDLKYQGDISDRKALIPVRVITDLVKLIRDDTSKQVTLTLLDDHKSVVFEFSKTRIVSRLIDGDFPDYQRIIPKEETNEISVMVDELKEAVKMASVFARDNSHILKWKIFNNSLTITANSTQVGEQQSLVDITTKVTEELTIAFNSRYLMELLNNITGKQLRIVLNDTLKPGVFYCDEPGFLHIIMPVRTQ